VHLITKYLWATKQNRVKFLTPTFLAACPLLCYRFSMTSKRWMNHVVLETNHLALIVLNWMLMLGNQANFWARASPKMAVCLQSFPQCDLVLVSDLYYAINSIFVLPMHVPMSMCWNQDSWLVYGTNKDSLSIRSFRKQCFLCWQVWFFRFWSKYVTFFTFVHEGESASLESVLL